MKPYYTQLISSICLVVGATLFGSIIEQFTIIHAVIIILLVGGGVLLSSATNKIVHKQKKQ